MRLGSMTLPCSGGLAGLGNEINSDEFSGGTGQ